jgi:hypothetical protein
MIITRNLLLSFRQILRLMGLVSMDEPKFNDEFRLILLKRFKSFL